MTRSLKERLKQGAVVAVCNTDYPTPQLVEFVGGLGFDAVFIDCEHSSTDFKLVEELARAARAAGITSLVRPWSNDQGLVNRYLSCGAGGVQVPHVGSVEEAAAIIEGLRAWEGDHSEKLLVLMIESKDALRNLPELLKLPEVDVFYIGAYDLALSMGFKGNPKHPLVKAAVEEAITTIAAAGKVAGMNLQDDIDALAHYRKLGLRWINVHLKVFMERSVKIFLNALEEGRARSD